MIPKKPQDATWNDQQWLAIHAQKSEILISAGAGSGKTAVLVERIIQKILAEKTNIDQLLVLTFTESSAAEMKERIRHRIESQLEQEDAPTHLQDQLNKLSRAQISTFHSFCSNLIRRYYYLLDLDPNFTIADEIEVSLIQDDVLENLFEERSDAQDPDFLNLVQSFNSDRDDEDLKTMLLKIYHQARANPDMFNWLQNLPNLYDWNGSDLTSWPYFDQLQKLVLPLLESASHDLAEASSYASLAALSETPHKYPQEVHPQDVAYLQGLKAGGENYETLRNSYYHTKLPNFPTFSKKLHDKERHDQAKNARNAFKDKVEKIKKEYFGYSNLTHQKHFAQNKKTAQSLSQLVLEFHQLFLEAKKSRRLLDFSDLEWNTLELLLNADKEPTEVALETHDRYQEIMIDEYQDTNSMQETIITAVAKAKNPPIPVFMVGDVKQSIYRFRLAEPSIFRNKYQTYAQTYEADSSTLKIDLMQNYRSHTGVIDATNYIFSQIMDEEVGEIAYDENAKLRLGVGGEPDTDFHQTEVHLLDKQSLAEEDTDDLSAVQHEAHHIARTITNWLQNNQEVYDRKLGASRALAYQDIVILMRSLSHVTTYQDVFRHYQIPLFTEQSTDLFSSMEIINMLSCLRVIDNPYQDIPLVGLMRSPLFFFNEQELSLIKKSSEAANFYDRVLQYAKDGPDATLRQKTSAFIERLQLWRFQSGQLPLSRLISLILEQTLYYEFVLGLPHGTLRKANLDVFLERAHGYEKSTKKGLYGFICHIERMQNLKKHFGKAKTVTATENVVRIMSIHKSKGLEFPVVFITSIQKQFNTMDEQGNYILHKQYGVALKYIDPDLRLKQKTVAGQLVSNILHQEMVAEEMRLLYVAMTRAKSKLLFTGVFDVENKLTKISKHATDPDLLLPTTYRMEAKSYSDFLLPAILKHQSLKESLAEYDLDLLNSFQDPSRWELKIIHELAGYQLPHSEEPEQGLAAPLIDLKKAFYKPYEFQELTGISAKQSVSQRKAEETMPTYTGIYEPKPATAYDRPSFMQEQSQSAAERGTAFHQFMQHLPVKLDWTLEELQQLRQRLVAKDILKSEIAQLIDLPAILSFTKSELYQQLTKAQSIKKEVPFMTLVQVGNSQQSNALLQGVIDLLAQFPEKVDIVDYKTDHVKDFDKEQTKLKERYAIQMKYYKKAIAEIFPDKNVSCHVYFIKASRVITY